MLIDYLLIKNVPFSLISHVDENEKRQTKMFFILQMF